jgi:hypothetical protein
MFEQPDDAQAAKPTTGLAYNPYASPRADPAPSGPSRRAPGAFVKWLYAGSIGIGLSGHLISLSQLWISLPAELGMAARGAQLGGTWSGNVLAAVWLYCAWNGLPEAHRGRISPARAALSLFVPFYNFYWIVVISPVFCDAVNQILARGSERVRAPRQLGLAAGILQLTVPFASFGVTIVLGGRPWLSLVFSLLLSSMWMLYMLQCDPARDAVARMVERGETAFEPRLSKLQEGRGSGCLISFTMAVLLFLALAIWQFLSPTPPRSSRPSSTSTHAP